MQYDPLLSEGKNCYHQHFWKRKLAFSLLGIFFCCLLILHSPHILEKMVGGGVSTKMTSAHPASSVSQTNPRRSELNVLPLNSAAVSANALGTPPRSSTPIMPILKLRVELIGDEYVLKEWEETLSPTSTLNNLVTTKGLGISWESWVQMWDQNDKKSTVQWYKAEHKRFLEEFPNIRRIEIYQNLYD